MRVDVNLGSYWASIPRFSHNTISALKLHST